MSGTTTLLKKVIKHDLAARSKYERSRRSRKRVTTVFDASTICNLTCEGCLYFSRDGEYSGAGADPEMTEYRNLFAAEKVRGVNYPIFGGAEPSLRQKVLLSAAEVWQEGMVHTNATVRMHPDIPYRLYVSMWGHREATAKWRGADCYQKVLRNVTGDERVIINYTISRHNIDDLPKVVADCAERGIRITFQVYSPTVDYMDVTSSAGNGKFKFIQFSNETDNLSLRPADNEKAYNAVVAVLQKYPDTIVFTQDLAGWVFRSEGIFADDERDEAGVPIRCSVANDSMHRHYLADLTVEKRKTCGHPEIDCGTCRLYTSIYTGYFQRKINTMSTDQSVFEYLDAHEVFYDIFYVH